MGTDRITIRPYAESDWEQVSAWWAHAKETPPLKDMMPPESSFIAEIGGEPALAVAIYMTNVLQLAYVENFIGNPHLRGAARRKASHALSDHVADFAKSRGYRSLLCFTEKAALKGRYEELGFRPTLGGVTALVRVL